MAKDRWAKSPITNKDHVLVDYDDANGESKMCIGSGFFTNENPLNYKKNPDFDISKYEKNMPQLMKDIRFDDGESYWYPTTLQTSRGMVYPEGTSEKWYWAYTPIKELTKEESEKLSTKDAVYESKLDITLTKRFDRFLEACKEMGGIAFGDLDG
jgi:hypothetical protein